jgi:copper transporter 1
MKYLKFFVLSLLSSISFSLDCKLLPSSPDCKTYKYTDENAQADIINLCQAHGMDGDTMPGCSINSMCQKKASSEPKCSKMSILSNICKVDMPMMGGCSNYTKICSESSVVDQCKIETPISFIPTTQEVRSYVKEICSSHFMEGCSQCSTGSTCDYLTVYANLCKEMPEMHSCKNWSQMCANDLKSWPELCTQQGIDPPSMRMYFHSGIKDYILFREFVPQNGLQYAFTVVFTILLGVLLEYLSMVRYRLDLKWSKTFKPSLGFLDENAATGGQVVKQEGLTDRQRLIRSSIRFVEILIGYSLMLIAMTFNIGMFFSAIVGLSLGEFLFGGKRVFYTNCACG